MYRAWRNPVLVLAAGAALALGGCSGTPALTDGSTGAAATAASSTQASTPAAGATGTAPASQAPTESGGASQAPAPSAPPVESGEPTVMPATASATLYYIAEGDAGVSGPTVGCGDSAVAVTSADISYTDPVEGALRTLLADHSAHLGESGLYNALWQSRLHVESVARSGSAVTAHLAGTLSMGGECDIPRIEQQLQLTAKDAAGSPVAITINGKTLSEALSLK